MISLGFLGFDSATLKSLSIAISSRAADVCQYVEPDDAQVVLVDIDRLQDPVEWRDIKRTQKINLIATSVSTELPARYKSDFLTVIHKPLRFTHMISSVCDAVNLDNNKITSMAKAASAVDKIDSVHKRRNTDVTRDQKLVDADNYLLGRVLQAAKVKDDYYFLGLSEGERWSDGQWIVLDKLAGKAMLNMTSKVLGHMAIMGMVGQNVKEKTIKLAEYEMLRQQAIWVLNIEEFIWILTRDTVRNGQLKSFNPDTVYKLTSWPNLTRYSLGNNDIALSNFWIENAASSIKVAEKLGVSKQEVVSFGTCCMTSGLLMESNTCETASAPVQQKGLKRMLSMILKKLDRT